MFNGQFALLAALCVGALAEPHKHDHTVTAVTTAPIYLPHYNAESWSLVRGSIIDENEAVRQTTYTIFCPNNDPPECDISLEFPFVLVEGPDTVEFHGTYTSTYIANLGCTLKGTTAATCSGYSSFKSGYTNGLHQGPTEVSWTATYTGSDVQWGVLTLAEKPRETDEVWDQTVTAFETPATASSQLATVPLATGEVSASGRLMADWRILIAIFGFVGFAL